MGARGAGSIVASVVALRAGRGAVLLGCRLCGRLALGSFCGGSACCGGVYLGAGWIDNVSVLGPFALLRV